MEVTKLKIKEKALTFSPKYLISDEEDNLIAVAKKHIFSFSKKATLVDSFGEEILVIRVKPFALRSTYYIELEGEPVFRIVKRWGIKAKIEVDSLLDDDAYLIQGNIWSTEYALYRNDIEFAYVSKKLWSLTGTYGVAIIEEFDLHLIIALVIVIDLISDQRGQG